MTYKVIQQYGEKWLRAINPFDENGQAWRGFKSSNPDIPYIGTRPEGTVLDESEVTAITQARHKDYTGSDWFNVYDNGNWDYYQTRIAYTDAEPHDRHISGWTHVSDALPEHLETVWLSNGKGFTTLGCLVWTEDGWHWAATNGVIYEENGRIVSECESDDIDAEYWHRLPDALKIDKEVKK